MSGDLDVDYTDGRWIATTTGQFLQILVDSGHDPCIIFRVDEDRYADGGHDDRFVRKMTVYSVPNGLVIPVCKELGIIGSDTHAVYKLLQEFIKEGLVS